MAQTRQKVVQAAEKLAARGRIQAAIDEYRKVLERHPNDTSTLNRVGDLYVRLNRMPKAIELFQKTAESFGRQGFFVKAIAIYKKIIRLDPGQIRAYEALADLYNRQGLTGDALAQYQVVAEYHMKHDATESAVNIYYSMVEIEPNNPTRRLKLASLLQGEGKTAKALDQYYEIASLMLAHSRGEDALRVLTGALDVDAANLDFVRKSINGLQDAGFDVFADELLESAIKRNPQANALRLDALEAPAPKAAAKASEAPVEEAAEPQFTPPLDADEEAVAEEDAADDAPAVEIDLEEAPVDDSEIDLSELEPLPSDGGLDPAVEVDSKPAPDGEAEAEVLDRESSFELDDAEGLEAVAEATLPASEAAEPEEDFSFELDIDEVSAELAVVDAEAEAGAGLEDEDAAEPAEEVAEVLPTRAAADDEKVEVAATPKRTSESAKLLIEADVLSRYGMDEMAISVLDRVLQVDPEHSEAMARVVLLKLRSERADEALVMANHLADLVTKGDPPQQWDELRATMAERGFEFTGGRFVGEVAPAPAEKPAPAAPPVEEAPPSVEEAAQSLEEIVAETAALARPKPKAAPDSTEDLLAEVIQEIERGGKKAPPVEASQVVTKAPEPEEAEELEDVDVEWIRELERAEATEESTAPLEPGTGEFVDLATELEAELSDGGDFDDELLPSMGEQSLEDIVEGFRQGMAETLSDEDYDTHYNLGIAYREMGLLDEAIGEFQLAAKDPRYLVECCSLLASCFVDKSFYDLAVQWYVRGLDSSALDEESRCGLLYELGTLLAATGEPEAARERFLELYGVNSNFRDVVAKLEELPT